MRFDTKLAITAFILVLIAFAVASYVGWLNWSEMP